MKRWIPKIAGLVVIAVAFVAVGYYFGRASSRSIDKSAYAARASIGNVEKSAYVDAALGQLNLEVMALSHVRSTGDASSKAFVAIENLMLGNILTLFTLKPDIKKLTNTQISNLCEVEAYVSKYGISKHANGQLKTAAISYLNFVSKAASGRYQPIQINPQTMPYMAVARGTKNVPNKIDIGSGCGSK